MICDSVQRLMSVQRELDRAERRVVSAHLRTCQACRAAWRDELRVRALISAVPDLDPPRGLEARLLHIPSQPPGPPPSGPGFSFGPHGLGLLLAAVALGAILTLGTRVGMPADHEATEAQNPTAGNVAATLMQGSAALFEAPTAEPVLLADMAAAARSADPMQVAHVARPAPTPGGQPRALGGSSLGSRLRLGAGSAMAAGAESIEAGLEGSGGRGSHHPSHRHTTASGGQALWEGTGTAMPVAEDGGLSTATTTATFTSRVATPTAGGPEATATPTATAPIEPASSPTAQHNPAPGPRATSGASAPSDPSPSPSRSVPPTPAVVPTLTPASRSEPTAVPTETPDIGVAATRARPLRRTPTATAVLGPQRTPRAWVEPTSSPTPRRPRPIDPSRGR